MSAIVITTAPYPSERTALLRSHSYSSSDSGRSDISTDSPNQPVRSAPLKDSISLSRFVIVCIGVWSANFVFAFQSTAIPTLAPEIGSWFEHGELSAYLGSMFTLANTAVIPLYGVFMETLGRKFAMVTACLFFGAGTIMCASAGNMYALIGARTFAGLGGGGLLTVSSVIVTDLVPLRDRGYYQGLMMTIFGSGSMLGGPVGGWLTDRFGWHWSFWIQLPVIVFCGVIVSAFLPTPHIPPTHRSLFSGLASLDWLGTALLIGSVTTLIFGFSFHTSYLEPWSSPTVWGMLLASVLSAAAFVLVEMKVKRPLVPLRVFKSNHISAVMLSGFFLSVSNQAFMYQIPVYFAVIVNTSTAQAGLIISLCGGLGLALGSLIAGQYIRSGYPWRWLGPISLVPPVVGALVAATWKPILPWWSYYMTVFPCILGYSTFLCVQLIALVSSVDSKLMPKATALLYTTRSLGATLGVSVGGSIQLGALASQLKILFEGLEARDQIINSILHSKAAIRLLTPRLQSLALSAYARSLSTVWLFSAGIAVLTVVSSVFIEAKEVHKEERRVIKGTGGGISEGGPFAEGIGPATIEGERQ
ncbi:hypothetical protein I312_103936 [Cryptococcus bacillisporus CA1280]|uniref:Multidrug resistance protein fnx1 n=2 Tax=Cryptococcus gattii TaxID=552467 RepID=A0A0D0VGJ8_CRYGA|nr:multidrug resistance protein fnx1 [Cryptococcus bacillisporus CA1280]KIR64125.1 multidrug resistance protein fnx1 [Cryptococcus bacillisporus CA1873]|eukprot:KIR64125.1 multidrug resistance protein fnx1 [Cryptococcus gattii CA1873]